MSSQSDQRIITSLALIAESSHHSRETLDRIDLGQQTANALSEAILETLKKNGSGSKGGSFARLREMRTGMKEAGISTLKDMKEAAEILPKLAIAMVKFNARVSGKVKGNVINFITDFRKAIAGDADSKADFEKFGKGFSTVAGSLTKMAFSMLMFRLVANEKTQAATLGFIEKFVEKFSLIDMDKVDKGADALNKMGGSLAKFTLGLLAVGAVMILAAPIAALIVIPAVAGLAFLYDTMGKAQKNINEGAKSIALVSGSLVLFALSMWAISEANVFDPIAMLKIVTSIAAFSMVYWLLGKVSNQVQDGAKAVGWMAIATAGFGLAMWAVGQLPGADLLSVISLATSMGVLAFAVGMIGKFSAHIAKGALVIAAMSIPLAMFAGALWIYKQVDFGIKDTGVLTATIVGVGLATAAAGLVAPFMIAGAVGLAAAGLGLIILSAGLAVYRLLNFQAKDVEGLKSVIGGMAEGFKAMGWGGGTAMLLGAVALTAASASLVVLSVGLGAYRLLNFKQADVEGLKFVIGGIAEGFKSMGWGGGTAMLLGSVALTTASVSLIALSAGLGVYRLLKFSRNDVANLKDVIGGIAEGFKSMGLTGGIAMTAGSVALVAASVGLIAISAALWIFKKTEFGKAARANMQDVVHSVADVFLSLKKKGFGEIKQGIDAVKDAGGALVDIARGVKAFANLEFRDPKSGKSVTLTPAMLGQIGANIELVLTAVSGAFSQIGKKDEAGLFTSGYVGKGIAAVKGMGAELTNIAKGVQSFASLNFGGVTITKDTFGQVKTNIASMIGCLTSVFSEIGSGESAGENEGSAASKFFNFGKNMIAGGPVERGLKAVRGLGAEILPIANAVRMFANSKFDPVMATSIGKGISGMINQLMAINTDPKKTAALGNMGRFLQRLSVLQKPLEGVNGSIRGIVASLERLYVSISKVNQKSMESASAIISSVATLASYNKDDLAANIKAGKQLLNYSIGAATGKNVDEPNSGGNRPAPAPQAPPKTTPAPNPNPGMGGKSVKSAPVVNDNSAAMAAAIESLTTTMGLMQAALTNISSAISGGAMTTREVGNATSLLSNANGTRR